MPKESYSGGVPARKIIPPNPRGVVLILLIEGSGRFLFARFTYIVKLLGLGISEGTINTLL